MFARGGGISATSRDGSRLIVRPSDSAAASITLKTYEWGSAKSSVDFTPVNVVVTFAPGETTKTVAVPIVNDSLAEGQESFGVSLSNPVGTTQASWSATVTASARPRRVSIHASIMSMAAAPPAQVMRPRSISTSDSRTVHQYYDQDIASEILRSQLRNDLPRYVEGLEAAADAGDLAQVGRAAHTIKGAVGNVCALRLCAVTEALEVSARAGDAARVAMLRPEFRTAAAELLESLATWVRAFKLSA